MTSGTLSAQLAPDTDVCVTVFDDSATSGPFVSVRIGGDALAIALMAHPDAASVLRTLANACTDAACVLDVMSAAAKEGGCAMTTVASEQLHAPDSLLGRARVARGWSADTAVRRLREQAFAWGWRQVPDADSVKRQLRRWEAGQRPCADYRRLLAAVYGSSEEALGLYRPPALPAAARVDATAEVARVVLDHAETLNLIEADARELVAHLGALKTSLRAMLAVYAPEMPGGGGR